MSSTRSRVLVICLCAVFALLAESAFATHFRYGYISWERDLSHPIAGEVKVEVTVEAGGRWTYPSWNTVIPPTGFTPAARCTSGAAACCAGVPAISPDAGSLSCPNPLSLTQFAGGSAFGGQIGLPTGGFVYTGGIAIDVVGGGLVRVVGKHGITLAASQQQVNNQVAGGPPLLMPMDAVVTQAVPTEDTFYGRFRFTIVYPANKTINIDWYNTNRLSQLLDANADRPWRLKATIPAFTGATSALTRSPKSQVPAVINVFTGRVNTVVLPSATFDNLDAKWSVASTVDSQLQTAIPVAPSTWSLTPEGVLQFQPRAVGLYAVQFRLAGVDRNTGEERVNIPIDVMFQATPPVATTLTLSTPAQQTEYTASVNQPFTYTVTSTMNLGAANYRININNTTLPAGATMSGSGQCIATGPTHTCTNTFNWTPSVTSTASNVCYTGTVFNGATLVTSAPSYCVTVNLNPLATNLVVQPASGASGGGPVVLSARLTRAIDSAPLPSRSVTFTFDASPGNPPWTGSSTVLTDTNGVATANLTLVRTVNPPSSFTATFNSISGELLASSSASSVLSSRLATTSLNAPAVAATPLPSVGYPTVVSAVLNRHFSDGGVFGVAQDGVTFTQIPPDGGAASTVNGGTTNAIGVSVGNLAAPAVAGNYSVSASFAGNENLIGPAVSTSTVFTVRQRTQLTANAGIASQNVPSPVSAVLVAIPSNTPIANRNVTFTSPGATSVFATTNASGVATAMMTFTALGSKVVTASFTPNAADELNRSGLAGSESSVANIDVQPAVATTMVAVPFSAITAQPATLTAHLESASGPVAGASVTFKTGAVTLGVATTDSNGDAALNFTPIASVDPTTYSAEFAGMPGYAPSNAIASYRIDKSPTQFSALDVNAVEFVGNPLNVSTTLRRILAPVGPVAGATVIFKLSSPDTGQFFSLGAATDANGVASIALPVGMRGQYIVEAQYSGSQALSPTTIPAIVKVYQKTNLIVTPVQSVAGASTAISAGLFTVPGGYPIVNEAVTLSVAGQGMSTTAMTNATGVASGAVTFPVAGTFNIEAQFNNLAALFADADGNLLTTTAVAQATVDAAISSVSLTAAANGTVGQPITLSAMVSRVSAPAGPVAGGNVTFSINGPEGTTTLNAMTDASGGAHVNYVPQEGGDHIATATYAGTGALGASTSAAANTLVIHQTALTIAPATGFAGSALPVQAVLRTVPGGLPVNGQSITFTFTGAGAPASVSAITNAAGVATASPTFAVPGTFTSQAAFSNAPSFYGDSSASATVTATNTAPAFSAPDDITTIATGPGGAAVSFIVASGSDLEDGPIAPVCSASSGATFPIGVTTVNCTVTDSIGLSASDSFTITVTNNAPTFSAPANITLPATSAAGRVVEFTAIGSDVEDGSINAICSPASGSTFALGMETVTCNVTDVAGATATGAFTVTIFNTAPTISDVADITGEATSNAGRAITFASAGNDAQDGALTPVCSAAPGTFPIGTTTVTCTVTDVAGATASDSFTITVRDTTAPSVTVESKTFEQTSTAGATGIFASSATDIVDGALTTACTPASGSTFARGTTTVTCSVTDARGNTGSATGVITVVDTIKPVVTYTGNAGTYTADQVVNITCAATDSGSGVATTTCANVAGPAHTFAVGVNSRTASATDAAGNTSSASISFTVTVPPTAVGNVITQFFDSPAEAAKANHTLSQATSAPNASSRAAHLNKLIKDIEKEIGKTISAAEAATLIALIQNLY